MAGCAKDEWCEIDECSTKKHESKSNLNQRTQRLLANISKIGVPKFIRRSLNRKTKDSEIPSIRRPVSMYINQPVEEDDNLSNYMHDSTIVMALRDTELRLLESEKHRMNLESKVVSLEKEIEYLQKENRQHVIKERAQSSQIQEFERRNQTKEAECQEMSLNSRIREMELSSEIAILSQKLSTIDTEKQEREIHKIMASQNRIMEQTLPYTMSAENIFDNEDGLFNNKLFEEVLREQTEALDINRPERSDDEFHFQDPDDYATSFD